MDSIRLKTKELQSKMYLTQTQTHGLRLIDALDSQKRSTLQSQAFKQSVGDFVPQTCTVKTRIQESTFFRASLAGFFFNKYNLNI